MVLTERQRTLLNGAILGYLEGLFPSAHAALSAELGSNVKSKAKTLERKWTTVIKLEKKIQDLEAATKRLEEELKNSNPNNSVFSKKRNKDCVPQSLNTELKGHRMAITHVQFHPSFAILVTSSEDNTLRVWDWEGEPQLEKVLKGHTDSVNHFDFHPDGTQLASASSDTNVKVWDLTNRYSCIRTLSGHEHTVSQVCYIESGAKLASSSRDFQIRIWDTDNGFCTNILTGHNEWVKSLSGTPNSSYLASGALDKTIKIWDTSNGKCIDTIRDFEQHVECISFGSRKTDEILLKEDEDDLSQTSYRPCILAVGFRSHTVCIYNLNTGARMMEFNGHNNWVRALTFHPNGKFLISVSDDLSIRVWDLSKRRCFFTQDKAHNNFIQTCAFNPQFSVFATGGVDKWVKVWDCS